MTLISSFTRCIAHWGKDIIQAFIGQSMRANYVIFDVLRGCKSAKYILLGVKKVKIKFVDQFT